MRFMFVKFVTLGAMVAGLTGCTGEFIDDGPGQPHYVPDVAPVIVPVVHHRIHWFHPHRRIVPVPVMPARPSRPHYVPVPRPVPVVPSPPHYVPSVRPAPSPPHYVPSPRPAPSQPHYVPSGPAPSPVHPGGPSVPHHV